MVENGIIVLDQVARIYKLKESRLVRLNAYLCLWCDITTHYPLFPIRPERLGSQHHYPNTPTRRLIEQLYPPKARRPHFLTGRDSFQLIEVVAATHGCHICRLFLSQLIADERENLTLLNFERSEHQHVTIQLLGIFKYHHADNIGSRYNSNLPPMQIQNYPFKSIRESDHGENSG